MKKNTGSKGAETDQVKG